MKTLTKYLKNRRRRGDRFRSHKPLLDMRTQLRMVEDEIVALKAIMEVRELGVAEGRELNSLGKKKRRLEKKIRKTGCMSEHDGGEHA